jgi:hypothetical protein
MKTRSPLLSLLLATMAGGCSGLPHIQQGAHAAPSAADTHKVFPDDAYIDALLEDVVPAIVAVECLSASWIHRSCTVLPRTRIWAVWRTEIDHGRHAEVRLGEPHGRRNVRAPSIATRTQTPISWACTCSTLITIRAPDRAISPRRSADSRRRKTNRDA